MKMIVDEAANDNCYATFWSYGEICVGCGCCSKDPLERAKARLEYNQTLLEDWNTHLQNLDPDPLIRAIQAQNIRKDMALFKRRIAYYAKRVKELTEGRDDD